MLVITGLLLLALQVQADCLNTMRSVAHGVVRDTNGSVIRYSPFDGQGLILDTNILHVVTGNYSRDKNATLARWEAQIHKLERTAKKHGGSYNYWVTDSSFSEAARREVQFVSHGYLPSTKRLPISVSRNSDEYKDLVQKLNSYGVGNNRHQDGAADQTILADIFFSSTNKSAKPTFATGDRGIFVPLCMRDPKCKKSMERQTYATDFPNGFDVTIQDINGNDRSIRILPFLSH